MEILQERWHRWLPIVLVIYLPISFIITYSIAVSNDHVEPGFPYISDTGTKSPESCVFGQLVNIGAVISGIIVYIRYRYIDKVHKHGKSKLNVAAFIIGILTNFGVSIVGNFQETNINSVHLIGAFLAFVVGCVYMILQTIISFKTVGVAISSKTSESKHGSTLPICIFRVILCVVDVILLIILGVETRIALSKGPGLGESTQKWSADEPGHTEHVIAAASEWMVAFVTVAYFATFYSEFKYFKMKPSEVEIL